MKKYNLSAFTILEMLINIAIMSIIIGMVYFVSSSFAKQLSFYQVDVEEETAHSSFCLLVKTDFFRAERIIGDENSFDIVLYDTNRIYYEVAGAYLYRIQGSVRDSIRIEKMDITSKEHPVTKEKLVQKLQISTILFEQPLNFTAAKKYAGVLEFEIDHGN